MALSKHAHQKGFSNIFPVKLILTLSLCVVFILTASADGMGHSLSVEALGRSPSTDDDSGAAVPGPLSFSETIVNEGFEGTFPPAGWTPTGHWGKSSCEKKTGNYSAWAEGSGGVVCSSGTYHPSETSLLTYGPFDLSDALTASIQFDLWLWSSSGDTFSWQASADGLNFFGSSLTDSFTPSWASKTLDLAAVPGLGSLLGDDSVWIRFRWQTDGFAEAFEGAYVDDVKITKTTPPKNPQFLPMVMRSCPAPGSLFQSYLSLNETSSASIADNPLLDLGVGPNDDFTVEGFFYVPDLENTTTDSLFYKQNSYWLYVINYTDQPDRLIFRLWWNPYTLGYTYIYYEKDLTVGWHHVAVTFDNELTSDWDLMALYLDGELGSNSVNTEWTPGLYNSPSETLLGGSMTGRMEEVRISNTVRYINLSYSVPTAPFINDASTLALYHFDELPGSSTFTDSSGFGNILMGAGGAVTAVCGGS